LQGFPVRYRTIVADPPWHYDGYANGLGRGGWFAGQTERARVQVKPLPYPTLTVAEIAALPVRELAEPNCWLFLWTTNRYLHDAFHVVEAWGFRYAQALVWSKTSNVSPFGGTFGPNRAEHLLACRRGSPPINKRWASSLVSAPKPNDSHSRKPDVFLDLIEETGDGPRVELFARRQRLGWDTWGNEALEHVELTS
jgi:N6-adenosine-specific RNA methylase IME4